LALGILIILQDRKNLIDTFRPTAFKQENGYIPPIVQRVSRTGKDPPIKLELRLVFNGEGLDSRKIGRDGRDGREAYYQQG